ncbi:26S proteasome non-ATPase regulatory subunit 9 [Apophysomyces sp. BC1034]|nr:26S proteasome non-ATPase regulatory subunit 9 [Apophysomyces sp. BC1015]KAG0173188.1 26S proteasome non-ATPase regulatory subunit 9 [Apophysomyces sp. BC1021]KAG0185413.1 26S proteasome non-ATPase regulatory subunit 9 [Apophysomyces sp. BC1034]
MTTAKDTKELVKDAQALIARKDALENELRELEDSLRIQGVGMDVPLVDRSGFPRSDVDVAAARTSRNLVYRLRNDHKALMAEIEQALYAIHEANRTQKEEPEEKPAATTPVQEETREYTTEFAIVNSVALGSPADDSGLQKNDRLVKFGHVHAENHNKLQAVNELVRQSQGSPIQVIVLRGEDKKTLSLTPRSNWGGRGTLGCHILPI